MDEKTNIEIHHQAVNDIMGVPPSWIVKWGATLFFLILLVPFSLSFLIDYPDTLKGEMEITIPSDTISYGEIKFDQLNFGKLELGQEAVINLYSYNKAEFGAISGTVVFIADEAEQSEKYFLVKVKIDKNENYFSDKVILKKGMLGTAKIIISNKKLIHRILKTI